MKEDHSSPVVLTRERSWAMFVNVCVVRLMRMRQKMRCSPASRERGQDQGGHLPLTRYIRQQECMHVSVYLHPCTVYIPAASIISTCMSCYPCTCTFMSSVCVREVICFESKRHIYGCYGFSCQCQLVFTFGHLPGYTWPTITNSLPAALQQNAFALHKSGTKL